SKGQLENTLANIHQQIDLNFSEHQAPFIGGILGYFNYEYNYTDYCLNATQLTPSMFGLFDWSLIQDHDLQKAYLVFLPTCAKTLQQEVLQLIHNAKETTAVKDSYLGA